MKKVLMISSQEIVYDLSDGGKQVSNRNWKLLLDLFGSENVILISFDKGYSNKEIDCCDGGVWRMKPFRGRLDRAFSVLNGNFFADEKCNSVIVDIINGHGIELVFIDRTLFGNLAQRIKKKTSALIWVFSHNLEAEYFANKFRRNIVLSRLMSSLAMSSEKKTILAADKYITLTKRDSDLSLKYYEHIADTIIPTSFEDRFDESKYDSGVWDCEKTLVFIGSNFNANYDGIKWFVDTVMPCLLDYKLLIVGKGFERNKVELTRINTCVIGYVDDLEPYYYADNIVIMPIFYGAGQKVKTAEAMMYGKTIVATDEALEGYEVSGINGIVRCNSCREFIEAIQSISADDIRKNRHCVRRLFLDKYSYSSALRKAEILLE